MDPRLAIEIEQLKKSAEKAKRMARSSRDAEHAAECLAISAGFEKLADDLHRLAQTKRAK